MFVDDGFAVKRVNVLPKHTETDMLQCASRLFRSNVIYPFALSIHPFVQSFIRTAPTAAAFKKTRYVGALLPLRRR